MLDERLCTMPEIYGHELQKWDAKRVFSKIQRDLPREYTDRVLRTWQVAVLLQRDKATIRALCLAGKISCKVTKSGRLFSIKDLSDYIADTNHRKFNGKKHGRWSKKEINALKNNGYCKTRSKAANKIMASRINNSKSIPI